MKTGTYEAHMLLTAALLASTGCTNLPPTVEITSPLDGEEFQPWSTINFKAELSDPESPVGYLWPTWTDSIMGELDGSRDYSGSTLLSLVEDVEPGEHTVTLEIEDPNGNIAQDRVSFVVLENSPPTVIFDSPAEGEIFSEGQNVPISLRVEDPNEESYQFFLLSWGDDALLGEAPDVLQGNGTADYGIRDLEPGVYTISVSVTDTYGGETAALVSFEIEESG